MREIRPWLLSVLLVLLYLSGCNKEESTDKYARPDWLAGKVYTQIKDTAIFTTFASCLELTGYDTIIDVSGSYTVFAPNNDAFATYFQSHPAYNSVEDIPLDELNELVKYHIVQNPWTKLQLMSLDVWGWIDPEDKENNKPRGYKRATLMLDEDNKYGVDNGEDENLVIVDTMSTSWHRRVATDSRKFAPIFFKDYFNLYDLSSEDYEFYFDRAVESANDLYYVNAKVLGDEIFAENGFIYNIDRVVEPLSNAYQIISSEYDNRSYSTYVQLVNQFPDFEYNEQKTFDQPGADLGLKVDSLFDLTFPALAFHLTKEKTKAPPGTLGLPSEVTIRYHHGMLAPTNEAIKQFENEYMPGGLYWKGLEGAPLNIKRIFANSHLSVNSVYQSDITKGFYTGELDLVTVDESSIIQKEYGSNASFMGINEVIIPAAFKSITGPVYLRRGFEKVMIGIEQAGLLSALKRDRHPDERYMFFVESDANTRADSSFLYNEFNESFYAYQLSGKSKQRYGISTNDLRTLMLNHVGVKEAKGIARKEFIPNLAGSYLIVNNETGEVSGTTQTTVGFRGTVPSQVIPETISSDASNGSTYEIDDWFSFSTTSIYLRLVAFFPEFHQLIVSAGLADTQLNKYKFVSNSEVYTVFAPTAEALAAAEVDSMTREEKQQFVKLHFLRKAMIFTDGNQPGDYYETNRLDESSTEFTKVYTKIYIEPGIDEIMLPSGDAGIYHTITESDSTNILAGYSLSEGAVTFPQYVNTAVIHKTDKALEIENLDVLRLTAR